MPLKISSVIPGSPAESLGLKPGDRLLSINGEQVRDTLDFHFCVADEDLEIEYLHETSRRSLSCYLPAGEDMGIEFEQEKIRTCGNDCLFCFVDQNPEGLRKTLYVKDEDYRLSFLHGNFITLTNLKDWEIERIIRQRLSPLYISVHSTDPDVRKRLLRPRQDRDILKLLGRLAEGNIRMHTQIVLCPGYNDGNDLLRTIDTLAEFYPAVESLAIVPLGMTDHREKTSSLDPVTPELAREIMMQARPTQRRFRRRNGITWLYLSDEFYRLVGRPVPPAVHYDDFPQLENGIGLTRNFFMQCDEAPDLFGRALQRGEKEFTLVTGELFAPILGRTLRRALRRTGEDRRLRFRIQPVPNHFFGRGVTVAGLLAGCDILKSLEAWAKGGRPLGDRIFLPPATVNDNGLFLDDMRPLDIEKALGVPVSAEPFASTHSLEFRGGGYPHELGPSCGGG